MELNTLLDTLQQPQESEIDSLDRCMTTLQRVNCIRQLPGLARNAMSDQLRLHTVEVEAHVLPGHDVARPVLCRQHLTPTC